MKTEGLSFTEAVQALSDGKCKEIKSPGGTIYCIADNGIVTHRYGGIHLLPKDFLGKWKLIGVKQKFVIEGVGWGKNGIDGVIYPVSYADGQEWSKFLNKPGMKMTLEWEE